MNEIIEFTVTSVDGIVDCQLEKKRTPEGTNYSVVILYPHHTNGIIMSKVYEHTFIPDPKTGVYYFSRNAVIHPSVKLLEKQLSEAIVNNR